MSATSIALSSRTTPADVRRAPSVTKRLVGVFLILLALFVLVCLFNTLRNTRNAIRLDAAGVEVPVEVISIFNQRSSGRRGSSPSNSIADVTYRFHSGGRQFIDTDRDVNWYAIKSAVDRHALRVRVLASNPEIHRLNAGHTRVQWNDTVGGCAVMGLFSLVCGMVGVGSQLPAPAAPLPPAADALLPTSRFFDQPPPRFARTHPTVRLTTLMLTLLVLSPPGYAGGLWIDYLVQRPPGDSLCPWDAQKIVFTLLDPAGLPYFLLLLPAYVFRWRRIRFCRRLARCGELAVATVNWKLKRPTTSRASRAVVKVNGMPINSLPDFKEDWVPYQFEIGGRQIVSESGDGRGLFSKAQQVPVAVYFPTGGRVAIVYNPANPSENALLSYLRYYLNV